MSTNIDEFKKLVDAEEFFIFFNLPYDQKFVNVNRLHILTMFSPFLLIPCPNVNLPSSVISKPPYE